MLLTDKDDVGATGLCRSRGPLSWSAGRLRHVPSVWFQRRAVLCILTGRESRQMEGLHGAGHTLQVLEDSEG